MLDQDSGTFSMRAAFGTVFRMWRVCIAAGNQLLIFDDHGNKACHHHMEYVLKDIRYDSSGLTIKAIHQAESNFVIETYNTSKEMRYIVRTPMNEWVGVGPVDDRPVLDLNGISWVSRQHGPQQEYTVRFYRDGIWPVVYEFDAPVDLSSSYLLADGKFIAMHTSDGKGSDYLCNYSLKRSDTNTGILKTNWRMDLNRGFLSTEIW